VPLFKSADLFITVKLVVSIFSLNESSEIPHKRAHHTNNQTVFQYENYKQKNIHKPIRKRRMRTYLESMKASGSRQR